MNWTPITFRCRVCSHPWQEKTRKDERDVITAAKANKQEPVCDLCRHLIMATRIANARKIDITKALIRIAVSEMLQPLKEGSPV